MFGSKHKEYTSPLEEGDHPEIDTSDELDPDNIKVYQSMIGSLQWAISLGCNDIQTSTMTMSRFRSAPRKGQLQRLKWMSGYLQRFKSATIRVRTEEPDFSALPGKECDCSETVYGKSKKRLPETYLNLWVIQ
jgi:hypothetical protein